MDAAREPVIMQQQNERARVVVEGKLVDGGGLCTIIAVRKRTGGWAFYPHGAGKLGVELSDAAVDELVRGLSEGATG